MLVDSDSSAAARSTPADPFVGCVLGGAYQLRERIGGGGMGTVYRAEQLTLGRSVAVKLVHPAWVTEASMLDRFEAEALAASRINHPNSVSIYDYGRAPDGRPYLVMEYVRGMDLATLLEREPLLSRPRVCRIVLGVLYALEEAHEHDIIHRDLKPDNVMLTRRRDGVEVVKVTDFGLAQVMGAGRRATQPGVLVGTPGYMSPEQIADEPLDARSDLYAVGVLLHELLTGEVLFPGKSLTAVVLRQLRHPAPDPREIAAGLVPDSLALIALRALERQREARFPSARAMADAVEAAARELESRTSWPDHRVPASDPRELGDATIEDALARLDASDRLLLQAACVLGDRVPLEAIGAVAGGPDPGRLAALVPTGLVRSVSPSQVELDPDVRRRVEASLPARAARELHDRAVVWHAHRGSPLAVRAEHACCGSDPLVALVLLDMLARDLRERGHDPVHVLRRGLELARHEFSRSGEEHYLTALFEFTRHLADVLTRQGKHASVRGLLREAIDLAPPTSPLRLPLQRRLQELPPDIPLRAVNGAARRQHAEQDAPPPASTAEGARVSR